VLGVWRAYVRPLSAWDIEFMNVYDSNWIVAASREEVWAALHLPEGFDRSQTTVDTPRVFEHKTTRVEVVFEGDEQGRGLARRCWFRAPWWLGGRARSWEVVTEVRAPEYEQYDVLLCAPPFARVKGWYRLEDLGDRRTRLHIHEEYKMESRFLAPLLEKAAHNFFLKDNDANFRGIIEAELQRRSAIKA
jgi:Polyketide cyclase / dehydrase and lipid transport